jgi:tripartite-type tricarboxylate transporter receptor subunit TctC
MRSVVGRLRTLLRVAACLPIALALWSGAGQAAYPERTIRMIVAYPPGGTGDLVGRVIAEGLSARLGVSVVVENQSGASGAIATAAVARAVPDGYTMLLAGNALFAILPHMTRVSYDPVKDFSPIANVSESLRILAASKQVPAATLPEFIAYAKANPGKLNYGSAGIGSTLHIMSEMFRRAAGFEAVHIPYRGAAPATQALLAGDIQFLIDTAVIPYAEQGNVRALAAVTERRLPGLPDVPTLSEHGFANIRTSGWQALLGPAKLPAEVVTLLNQHLVTLYDDQAFLARLAKLGVSPRYRTPAELAKELREDYDYFQQVLSDLQIKSQ